MGMHMLLTLLLSPFLMLPLLLLFLLLLPMLMLATMLVMVLARGRLTLMLMLTPSWLVLNMSLQKLTHVVAQVGPANGHLVRASPVAVTHAEPLCHEVDVTSGSLMLKKKQLSDNNDPNMSD